MLNDLVYELAQLYPNTQDARRLASEAGIPSVFIDFDGAAINVWRQVVTQARLRGQLVSLVKRALDQYPNRTTLREIFGHLKYGANDTVESDSELFPEDNKFDKMYTMVLQTNERLARVSERLSVTMTWLIALTIIVLLGGFYIGWRLP